MTIKFDTTTFESTYNDFPSGYATAWIFSKNAAVDYSADILGLDYTLLTEMDWHDARLAAIRWAEVNEYDTVYVDKDASLTSATVWGA